ncbi:putative oxidoreductase [Candidatus Kryptobacter tengchongensis]|nr:putative oxidoreductase [Candidatus Kryptobacter tengchongensis]
MLKASNIAIFLLRFVSGLMLAYFHGLGKVKSAIGYFIQGNEWKFLDTVRNIGFPAPGVFALAATISEFIGGILLAVGLFTRYSAIFIAITMGVAIYRHLTTDMRFELAGLYFLIALVFVFKGGKGISINGLIKKGYNH